MHTHNNCFLVALLFLLHIPSSDIFSSNSFNIYIKEPRSSSWSEETTSLPRLSSTNTILLLTTGSFQHFFPLTLKRSTSSLLPIIKCISHVPVNIRGNLKKHTLVGDHYSTGSSGSYSFWKRIKSSTHKPEQPFPSFSTYDTLKYISTSHGISNQEIL